MPGTVRRTIPSSPWTHRLGAGEPSLGMLPLYDLLDNGRSSAIVH
jgi:hypothetical protein